MNDTQTLTPSTNNPSTNPTDSREANLATVQRFYEAFGRGDLEAALADLADDIDWAAEAAGNAVPWYGNFRGKADVPRFFEAIGSNVEIHEFTPVSFTSNDTDVVATIRWSYTVNATGRSAAMYMQHWWKLAGGKIVFFRGSEDSAQSVAAFA